MEDRLKRVGFSENWMTEFMKSTLHGEMELKLMSATLGISERTVLGGRTIDQAPGAAAFAGVVLNDGARDVNFVSLGQVTVADGDFALSVDDSINGNAANTFIFADAVLFPYSYPTPTRP